MNLYHPSLTKVREFAEQGNLVPIWRELPADLETPVSVYLKLRREGPSFLLESVEKGEQLGRYSFLGFQPAAILTAREGQVSMCEQDSVNPVIYATGNALEIGKEILSQYPADGIFYNSLSSHLSLWLQRF